jgi:hypothetical protein
MLYIILLTKCQFRRTESSVHQEMVSPIKGVESGSDRMPNIILKVRWCVSIVLRDSTRDDE